MSAKELMNDFLDTVNDTVSELADEVTLLPDGLECNATIAKLELQSGMAKSKDGESERPWFGFQLQFELDSQEAREALGRDKVVRFGRTTYLNFDENRQLAPRDNVELGKLLKICEISPQGLSTRALLDSLVGQYVRIRSVHRTYETKSGETKTAENIVVLGPSE